VPGAADAYAPVFKSRGEGLELLLVSVEFETIPMIGTEKL
jgi:hypothetical protein